MATIKGKSAPRAAPRLQSQLGVRLALDAMSMYYKDIRQAPGIEEIVQKLKRRFDSRREDLEAEDSAENNTSGRKNTGQKYRDRVNASTAVKYILRQGQRSFSESTEETRKTWDDIDWVCYALVGIIKALGRKGLHIFKGHESYMSIKMIRAAHVFYQYFTKEETGSRGISRNENRGSRGEPLETARPEDVVNEFDQGARIYPSNFKYPDRFAPSGACLPAKDRVHEEWLYAQKEIEALKDALSQEKLFKFGNIPFEITAGVEDGILDIYALQDEFDRLWDNKSFQDQDYLAACTFLQLDPKRPAIQHLDLGENLNGEPECLLPHQVIAVAWLIKKELLYGIPGLVLADFCGSGKSIVVLAILLLVREIYMNREHPLYIDIPGIQNMNTRPTLLVCPAAMLPGWVAKFEENLGSGHPFQIIMYNFMEEILNRDDEIFRRRAPQGKSKRDWDNCRIILVSLETWTRKHPAAAKICKRHKDGIEYLLMGDPNREEKEVLTGKIARVIIDEGHRIKGGAYFDRSASLLELEAPY